MADDRQPAPDQSVATALDAFARSKGTDGEGRYVQNVRSTVNKFVSWFRVGHDHDPRFDELGPDIVRAWVRDGLRSEGYAASSVKTYFNNLSAYLGWCVREGLLDSNPCERARAREPLPDENKEESRPDRQQSWSDTHRRTILQHVELEARQAFDDAEDPREAVIEYRNLALVSVLALSGVRGGEVLRDPQNPNRDGLQWREVDTADQQMIRVWNKRSEWSDRPVTSATADALDRLENLLQPADDWPVFVSSSYKALQSRLRDRLIGLTDGKQRLTPEDVDAMLADCATAPDFLAVYREYEIPPPALTTEGGRYVMKKLTDEAGIEVDGRHNYLAPHGARRGLGEVLVRERGYDEAATQLDNTAEVVRDAYSHIDAGERAADLEAAIEEYEKKQAKRD